VHRDLMLYDIQLKSVPPASAAGPAVKFSF
jgi:hypothetical protein